jgi:hypothetical protein
MFRKIALLAATGAMVVATALPAGAAPKGVHEGRLAGWGVDSGRVKITERADGTYAARVQADGLAPGVYTFYFGDSRFTANEACTFTPDKKGRGQCSARVSADLVGDPYVAAIARNYPNVVSPEGLAFLD